jgi:hypothetical protein
LIAENVRNKYGKLIDKGMLYKLLSNGWAPLGYEVQDRKLLVNEIDAKLVRSIFHAHPHAPLAGCREFVADAQRFLKLGSATTLADHLALKLCKGQQNVQCQPAHGCGGVEGLCYGDKSDVVLIENFDQPGKIH